MSKKFLVAIDLNKNELLNARLQNLATAPGTPAVGQTYYDTATNAAYVWNGTAWVSTDASKVANGAIPLAKLATDPLARANHTGTQLAATISDFDTQVRSSRLDQMAAPTADVSLNSRKITSLATPTVATDAANKQYVDNMAAGIKGVKDPVRVAVTSNVNLASPGASLDGVALSANDRFLATAQTTTTQNGIYIWNGAAVAATRASDSDETGEVVDGTVVAVAEGTDAGKQYIQQATPSGAPGAWTQTWTIYSTGGQTYTAGNGLSLTGNDFNIGAGTGISVGADSVSVDTAVVVRKYATNVGDNSATSIAVTHNLNTLDVTVGVYTVSDGSEVECDVVHTSVNVVTLTFAVAPTASQYRAVVHG